MWHCCVPYAQFVAASGSISKSKDFKSQMKAAFNACNLRSDGCISALEVHFFSYFISAVVSGISISSLLSPWKFAGCILSALEIYFSADRFTHFTIISVAAGKDLEVEYAVNKQCKGN